MEKMNKDMTSNVSQEKSYDEKDVFEMEHSQLYYYKDSDDQSHDGPRSPIKTRTSS